MSRLAPTLTPGMTSTWRQPDAYSGVNATPARQRLSGSDSVLEPTVTSYVEVIAGAMADGGSPSPNAIQAGEMPSASAIFSTVSMPGTVRPVSMLWMVV